jgi:hypothetical protein
VIAADAGLMQIQWREGEVSVQLPVPKAPLFSWSAKSRRRGPLAASGSTAATKQKSITAHRIPVSARPRPCGFRE